MAPGPLRKVRRRIELALYGRQLRRVVAAEATVFAIDRAARWLRPGCGSLCEIDPGLATAERCLASLGTRPWRDTAGRELLRFGELLPRRVGDHDCDRYRFALTTSTR